MNMHFARFLLAAMLLLSNDAAAASSNDYSSTNIRASVSSSASTQDKGSTERDQQEQEERDLGRTKKKTLHGAGKHPPHYTCGAGGCDNYDFAYIHLEGEYFFGQANGDSSWMQIIPIDTEVGFETVKEGATIRVFQDQLQGYSMYFNHGDDYPYKQPIEGELTGSCTILAFPLAGTSNSTKALLAHCTLCVSYAGCCNHDINPWEPTPPIGNCTGFGGFTTMTGDLLVELQAVELQAGEIGLIGIQSGGLSSADFVGALTGYNGELGPASGGGIGFIEYDSSDPAFDDSYKIGLKVPFNDKASCKLQDRHFVHIEIPTRDPSPPTSSPSFSPSDVPSAAPSGAMATPFPTLV